MKNITGEISEFLVVESPTTVNGAVSAGATVRTGQHLIINGRLLGPLTLEKDAFCTVYGMFGGTIEPGDGLAMLYGMVNTPPSEAQGDLAVGINSLILQEDGKLYTLRAEGNLEEVVGDVPEGSHSINGGELCIYLPWEGKFSPVPIEKPKLADSQ
jgi:hypothetical protein